MPKIVLIPVVVVYAEPDADTTAVRASVEMALLVAAAPPATPPTPKMVVWPVVVVNEEPEAEMRAVSAEVVMALDVALPTGTLCQLQVACADRELLIVACSKVSLPEARAEAALATRVALPLAVEEYDLSASKRVSKRHAARVLWVSSLTATVCQAEGDDLACLCVTRAGLLGAIAHAVAEVGLRAVAGDVAGRAAELGAGDLDHVVDACLLGGDVSASHRTRASAFAMRKARLTPH